MQVGIVNGSYVDANGQLRTRYPVNYIPIPKQTGLSKGFYSPAPGVELTGTGTQMGRGGINWNGKLYRVMGTKLVSVDKAGVVTELGEVGGSAPVTLDYSFTSLGIASNKNLFYWDGQTLTQVTDVDLGKVVDAMFIEGYWMTTDGTSLIVTELNDPYSVLTTKYGSAEADPDPVLALDRLRNEAYVFGRYTIEVFQNIGGTNFPFQRVEGAQVQKGVLGTKTYCEFIETFAFLGSSRNEPPGVYLMTPGSALPISTQEINQLLAGYTEEQLASSIVESQVDKSNQFLFIHLPDQSLVYDAAASRTLGEPAWHIRMSGLNPAGRYRARNLVWVYDDWHCEDSTSFRLGKFVDNVSTHFGDINGWEFNTGISYNQGDDAIVHEMELVSLPGRVQFGLDPVVWTSYSKDGQRWSLERTARAGRQGETLKRIVWRGLGTIGQYRIQRFRGTSDTHMAVARLEVRFEPLNTRPGNG